MLGLAILCLMLTVVFAIMVLSFSKKDSLGWGIFFAFMTIFMGTATIRVASALGYGHHLTAFDLNDNEIYEIVGAGESDGVFYVTLRDRDGDIRTFRLDVMPPPIFKMIRIDFDTVKFRPYPTEN